MSILHMSHGYASKIGALLLMGYFLTTSWGCANDSHHSIEDTSQNKPSVWQPVATSMRVHPATQYRTLDNSPVLEVRVEMTDSLGDPIKVSAIYRFELSGDGINDEDTQYYAWDERVLTKTDHLKRYDAVTRCYVFPLALDDFDAANQPTRLWAQAQLIDGRKLEAMAQVVPRDLTR
ncbi:MAG: hypothetical protein AAGB29_01515 [Planctomycetota bacterium]